LQNKDFTGILPPRLRRGGSILQFFYSAMSYTTKLILNPHM
jgi:hypothetical protein